MSIESCTFENEEELHAWVEQNIGNFLGEGIYLDGFPISTKRKKGAAPDGFFLDLGNQSWTIVESELIGHGVWDHIAEQIMRFIVASQNGPTQRKIRNGFFEQIEKNGSMQILSKKLGVEVHRLLETIETIIESSTPEIAIFIDDVNEDLKDMAEALNATVGIFRVQKYKVDGRVHYLSPDRSKTIFETTEGDVKDAQGNPLAAIASLGGGKIIDTAGHIKMYELRDGTKVVTKYSRQYPGSDYWFGITPNVLDVYHQKRIDYVIFILGNEGLVKAPLSVIDQYIKDAHSTKRPDGSIKWYHVHLRTSPDVSLHQTKSGKSLNIEEYFSLLG